MDDVHLERDDVEAYINKLKIKNYEYHTSVFCKATKKHIICIHSKVDNDNNVISYQLSVKYRDTYDTVNGGPISHCMIPLKVEFEFISCDIIAIMNKFTELYTEYTELDRIYLTWSDITDSVVYSNLLMVEAFQKHLFYIDIFKKYFSDLKQKSGINILINNIWSYEYAYDVLRISPEFLKTVSYEANIETGEFAKYFDIYMNHICDNGNYLLFMCDAKPLRDDDLVLHLTI